MKLDIPEAQYVNVLVSGGIDSALLMYLVLQERPKSIINACTFGKRNLFEIENIYTYLRWFGQFTPVYFSEQRPIQIRPAVETILSLYPGVALTGCNLVLDHLTPSVFIPGDTPPWRGPALNEFHLRPFINTPKIDIVREFQVHKILDLLPLTRSCGLSAGVCGECYFCLERNEAIAALELPT